MFDSKYYTDLRDKLLVNLENLVGKRNEEFEFLDTRQDSTDVPCIWYPNYETTNNKPLVYIRLTHSTERYYQKGFFQTGHEIVHLLDPTGGRKASNLEEAFATYNSVVMSNRYYPDYLALTGVTNKYREVYDILVKIKSPYDVVKIIRENGYTLTNVPVDFLFELAKDYLTKEEVVYLRRCFYTE